MSQPAAPCQRHDLSIDQQHALFTAARNLTDEFSGAFGTETINRFLHSSYDQFADRASVANYLPLLAVGWSGGSEPGYLINPAAI